jgi:hypothetical protein
MRKPAFDPCIPTRGTKVPDRPEWFHEIKHDGYRLIVQREGKTVRLWTRNGYDWSSRYPRIVEAALRQRPDSFVLDGEAVLLGVDGIADFNGLHSRKHDDEVQLYAFDVLMYAGDDLRPLPLRPFCSAIGDKVSSSPNPPLLPLRRIDRSTAACRVRRPRFSPRRRQESWPNRPLRVRQARRNNI